MPKRTRESSGDDGNPALVEAAVVEVPAPPPVEEVTGIEVFFEPTMGDWFNMSVEFSDTIEGVKQKIKRLRKIPVRKQALIYRDEILRDNTDFNRFRYFKPSKDESRLKINVVIAHVWVHHRRDIPPPKIKKIPVLMKLPVSNKWDCIETHSDRRLKQIIGYIEKVAVRRIVIRHAVGDNAEEEMDDGKMLYEFGIDGILEVNVSLQPMEAGVVGEEDCIKVFLRRLFNLYEVEVHPEEELTNLWDELHQHEVEEQYDWENCLNVFSYEGKMLDEFDTFYAQSVTFIEFDAYLRQPRS